MQNPDTIDRALLREVPSLSLDGLNFFAAFCYQHVSTTLDSS